MSTETFLKKLSLTVLGGVGGYLLPHNQPKSAPSVPHPAPVIAAAPVQFTCGNDLDTQVYNIQDLANISPISTKGHLDRSTQIKGRLINVSNDAACVLDNFGKVTPGEVMSTASKLQLLSDTKALSKGDRNVVAGQIRALANRAGPALAKGLNL